MYEGLNFYWCFAVIQALIFLVVLNTNPLREVFRSLQARNLLHGIWISFAFGVFVSCIKTIVDDPADRNWMLLPKAGLATLAILAPIVALSVQKHDLDVKAKAQ